MVNAKILEKWQQIWRSTNILFNRMHIGKYAGDVINIHTRIIPEIIFIKDYT